jgi:flagellum-specific peptidoglycan hydrolase FlgJ
MALTATSGIAASDARSVRQVAPARTSVSSADLRAAIGRAYRRVTGKEATGTVLDTLTAQASLETAGGAQMYNFNFGGIKGAGTEGTANYLTHEVTSAGEVTVKQGFRAYGSIDEGAEDYIRVLSHRFGVAFSKAQIGDIDGFAHALKQAGYYTASETDYASALHAFSGQPSRVASSALQPLPALSNVSQGDGYSTTDQLSRVIDALSSSALRIAAPARDEA